MRKNSKKQTAASRKNGTKSPGPKSAEGKKKSRMNALKDGLFSKQVVVTAAGERVEDFERLEALIWDSFRPHEPIRAILTNDVVENLWGRQRVRRCKYAALQNRLIHDLHFRSDEIEPLKLQFQLCLERHQSTTASTPSGDLNQIVTALENVRGQLASTPVGLEFLIRKVNAVKEEVESTGQMSPASEVALRACAGFMNESARFATTANRCNKALFAKLAAERGPTGQRGGTAQTKGVEPEKARGDQSGGKKGAGRLNRKEKMFVQATLVFAIENVARALGHRKKLLEAIEQQQGKTRRAAAVLRDDRTNERFERAERPYHRRLYRALAALHAMKQGKDASKILN